MRRAILVAVAALALAACKKKEQEEPLPVPPAEPSAAPEVKLEPEAKPEPKKDVTKATEAAKLANQIQADPASSEAILRRADLTEKEFAEQLYEIAEDPDLAEAYAGARTAAK